MAQQTLRTQFRSIVNSIATSDGSNLEHIFDLLFPLHQFIKSNCEILHHNNPVLDFFRNDTELYIDSLFNAFNNLTNAPAFAYHLDKGEFDAYYIISLFLQFIGTICTSLRDGEVVINGDTFTTFIQIAIRLFELNTPRIHHDDYDYDSTDDDDRDDDVNDDDDDDGDETPQHFLNPKHPSSTKRPSRRLFTLPKLGHDDLDDDDQDEAEDIEHDLHKEIINDVIAIIHCIVVTRESSFSDQLLRFCYFCAATKHYNTTPETQFYIPYWFTQVQQEYFTLLFQQFEFQSHPQLVHDLFEQLCPGEDFDSTHLYHCNTSTFTPGRYQFHHRTRVQPQYINPFSLIAFFRMCADLITFFGENAIIVEKFNSTTTMHQILHDGVSDQSASFTPHNIPPHPLQRIAFFINQYYPNDDHTIIDMSLNILVAILRFINEKLFHLPVSYIQTVALLQSIAKTHNIRDALGYMIQVSPIYADSPSGRQSPYHSRMVQVFGGLARIVNPPTPQPTSVDEVD